MEVMCVVYKWCDFVVGATATENLRVRQLQNSVREAVLAACPVQPLVLRPHVHSSRPQQPCNSSAAAAVHIAHLSRFKD